MRCILGIDPGLASVGYGVIRFDGTRYTHLGHGLISTSSEDCPGDRLLIIRRGIDEVLDRFSPDEAGMETLYFNKNVQSALPVAQARGVILFTLAERGIACGEYTPLQIKQAIIGRGRAEKRQIQEILRLVLGLEEIPHPDHAADALAAAICHANISGELRRLLAER